MLKNVFLSSFCVLFSTSVLSRIPQGILDCIYQEEKNT